jgi:hypothetical protein
METYVLRLWLPDRPGALGQVASRIGAVDGDVIGIDILERGGGSAIDELTVTLPHAHLVDLLLAEVRQVDGVAVENIHRVEGERPDPTVAALNVAADIAAAPVDARLETCCGGLQALFEAEWTAAWRADDGALLAKSGPVPESEWLGAFLHGARHLDATADDAPGDVLWAWIGERDQALACGRSGRPFHSRERQQLAVLARLLDGLPD